MGWMLESISQFPWLWRAKSLIFRGYFNAEALHVWHRWGIRGEKADGLWQDLSSQHYFSSAIQLFFHS